MQPSDIKQSKKKDEEMEASRKWKLKQVSNILLDI